MDSKTKELIAIGAAMVGHCQPCLNYHVAQARKLGLGAGEIREAIEVGQMVERGATAAIRDFAKEITGEPVGRSSVCCGDMGDISSKCGA